MPKPKTKTRAKAAAPRATRRRAEPAAAAGGKGARKAPPVGVSALAEPTVRAAVVDWTPDLVRTAELLADQGDLRMAADLVEAILADDKVQGGLTTLVGALLGLPLKFEAGVRNDRGRRAVKAIEAGEDWWSAFPESELTVFITWAVVLGVAVGEIEWVEDPDTGRLPGKLKFWSPRLLRWDGPSRRWMLRVGDDGREIPIQSGDGKWIVFAPKGGRRPWAYGAWRAIARWWLLKRYAISDWGAHSERHGQGTLVAHTMGGMNQFNAGGNVATLRKELVTDLRGLARNSVIALPAGWDAKLLEATASTWQTFKEQKDAANEGITVALHGTNLTNEQGGSYAKAQVLNGVHIQVVRSLAGSLSTSLHDGHLVWWAEFNFGDRKVAPWPAWDVSPPADLKGKADALGSLANALQVLVNVSDRVDVEAILEEHKVPMLAPGAAPAKKPEAPAPPTPPPAKGAGAERPGELADVAHPEHDAAAGKGARRTPGYVRGQVYADALADEARDQAAAILGGDVRKVLRAIEEASDYEGLRAKLVSLFAGMKPALLADRVEKAILLAQLAGRFSVVEDTR